MKGSVEMTDDEEAPHIHPNHLTAEQSNGSSLVTMPADAPENGIGFDTELESTLTELSPPAPFTSADFEDDDVQKTCALVDAASSGLRPPVPFNHAKFEEGDGRKKKCIITGELEVSPRLDSEEPSMETRQRTSNVADEESPPVNNVITADVQTMSGYFKEREEIFVPEATPVDIESIPSATVVRPDKYALTIAGHKIQLRFLALGVVVSLGAVIVLAVTLTKNGGYSEGVQVQSIPAFAPSNNLSASLFPSLDPSTVPSTIPTSTVQDELMDIISEYSGGNVSSSFSDGQSKHRMALNWLVDDQSNWRLEKKELLSDTEIVERFALALVYYETHGEDWFKPFEFMTKEHVCKWRGILFRTVRKGVTSCTSDMRVKNLTLPDNNLQGRLPTEIGMLQELTALHIGRNDIQGNIPNTLGSLAGITHLELNNNDFTGPIESLAGLTSLQFVDLSSNEMTGSLVDASNLTKLESFKVNGNKFSGSVPKSFSNISSLEILHLQWNKLSDSVDFLCQDLPSNFRLDCDGDKPEVTCTCCVGCTIVNDTSCDTESEKALLMNINAGNESNDFKWELYRNEFLIAAGGEYDNGQKLSIQMCASFPGEYDLFTSVATDGDADNEVEISFVIEDYSSSIGPDDADYFAITAEGTVEKRFVTLPMIYFPQPPEAFTTLCIDLNFELNLTTDAFGLDTSWEVFDKKNDAVVVSESGFASNQTFQFTECLDASGCYEFDISDAWDDGLCCDQGTGSYNVSVNGRLIGTGGQFGSSETVFLGGSCAVQLQQNE